MAARWRDYSRDEVARRIPPFGTGADTARSLAERKLVAVDACPPVDGVPCELAVCCALPHIDHEGMPWPLSAHVGWVIIRKAVNHVVNYYLAKHGDATRFVVSTHFYYRHPRLMATILRVMEALRDKEARGQFREIARTWRLMDRFASGRSLEDSIEDTLNAYSGSLQSNCVSFLEHFVGSPGQGLNVADLQRTAPSPGDPCLPTIVGDIQRCIWMLLNMHSHHEGLLPSALPPYVRLPSANLGQLARLATVTEVFDLEREAEQWRVHNNGFVVLHTQTLVIREHYEAVKEHVPVKNQGLKVALLEEERYARAQQYRQVLRSDVSCEAGAFPGNVALWLFYLYPLLKYDYPVLRWSASVVNSARQERRRPTDAHAVQAILLKLMVEVHLEEGCAVPDSQIWMAACRNAGVFLEPDYYEDWLKPLDRGHSSKWVEVVRLAEAHGLLGEVPEGVIVNFYRDRDYLFKRTSAQGKYGDGTPTEEAVQFVRFGLNTLIGKYCEVKASVGGKSRVTADLEGRLQELQNQLDSIPDPTGELVMMAINGTEEKDELKMRLLHTRLARRAALEEQIRALREAHEAMLKHDTVVPPLLEVRGPVADRIERPPPPEDFDPVAMEEDKQTYQERMMDLAEQPDWEWEHPSEEDQEQDEDEQPTPEAKEQTQEQEPQDGDDTEPDEPERPQISGRSLSMDALRERASTSGRAARSVTHEVIARLARSSRAFSMDDKDALVPYQKVLDPALAVIQSTISLQRLQDFHQELTQRGILKRV